MARFEWEDEDDDKPTAPTASTRGTQQTIEGWLNRIEAIGKAKADNLRNEPTQANAQAAVAAQDAAMKQAEAIQQNAIGIQQRAILQAKAVKNEKKPQKTQKTETKKTQIPTDEAKQRAEEIKKQYQANRTDEEKALIRELVESGRKCKSEEIIQIDKADAGGIVWMETGTENAGLGIS